MTRQQMLKGMTRLFVARPILAFVINLLIIIAGIAAVMGVEVREMPDVDQPSLSVRTSYDGASAEVVDREVTSVLEDAFGALDGIKAISSTSSYGRSRITLDLNSGADVDIAANEAREIVSQTLRQLPDDVDDPTVRKSDADADPIIRLALSGSQSLAQLTSLAEGMITDRLSLVDGIAEITVTGSQAKEFRLTVSMPSLLARGLTLGDVTKTLRTLRNDYALGSIESDTSTTILRSVSPDVTAELVGGLRINSTTYVADIADVQFTAEDTTQSARVNGRPSIGIDIVRQSVGNTLTISQDVRTAVSELQQQLPDNVSLTITTDDGVFIQGSIEEVSKSILMAIGIVIVVIFLFLRSWRATLIPALAIPVALIGTIAAIWIVGFSINTISLLALVLATGMVVDDAIVVVENIVRRRHEGEGPRLAAITGSNEVFFAVISTTATLAAVFIPISFLPGQAGGVFSEFGFVLAFCVTLSTVVALTMAPMLASLLDPGKPSRKMIKADEEARENGQTEPKDGPIAGLFHKVIDQSIRLPFLTLGIAMAFAVFAVGASQNLTSTLTPPEDRGMFFIIAIAPVGSTNDYMSTQIEEVEGILEPYRDSGEVTSVLSLIGRGGGQLAFVIVRLADWSVRERDQATIGAEFNKKLSVVSGIRVLVRSPNSLGIRGGGSGLQFAVTGNNYETLVKGADKLIAAMNADPVFTNAQLSRSDSSPQISVDIDRDRALELGITPDTIADTISAMTQGLTATSVFIDGEEVDLLMKPGGKPINDPSDLEQIFARTNDGNIIPLSSVATFEQGLSQASYSRENGSLAVGVRANVANGVALGQSVSRVRELASEALPLGTGITLLGEAAELDSSRSGTIMIFAIAAIIVFLVLSAQFESFVSAIIIMLTVPFGLAAAMLAITITGGTLNYYSQIGLVMLIGVMAKNGILIVEFANQLRERGQDIDSAIRDAVRLRIRPVMMTMVSTVFGGLPLILTSGAGAEARTAVGWVVVGGLGFATVFTLFLIPVLYRWIAPFGGEPGGAAHKVQREAEAHALKSEQPSPAE
ncbi:hydrophobe/amphiphile efflux-1 (HAE1) family protein [Cohaesibacter sp. ES.047]|uniref:efflux RND transporter permease subunit n=1 Tax=Cohaesibacter sp. ES.047 TaxID=1798205 RepID=UPI000BB7DA87|nr:efflux RND transporter permease subunit [Cohaesibacter sp. ES.047]SNY91956.1 hydrophobe/amphiphile efflux-1 (HAE1) family protein [Cohaesibacter sp. ES.047]